MSINRRVIREDDGRIIFLADVPNAGGTVIRKTGSKIGNKRHDSASGKFTKGKKPKPGAETANVDPAEFERMRAAARDAAREFDVFDEGDIKEFLAGRAKDSSKVDLQQFMAMVRAQRVSDIADLLDQQLRASGSMKQGRRKVRLTAPRGFTRKALKDITPEEARVIVSALTARGHTEEESAKFFESKNFDIQMSDEMDDEPTVMMQFVETLKSQPTPAEMTASIAEAFAALPPPQVTVNLPEPKPRKMRIERGPNGLIQSVEDDR